MATAVEPSSAPRAPGKPLSLPIASLLGTIYVLAVLAIVSYAMIGLWAEHITPLVRDNLVDWFLWLPAVVASLVVLFWFGLQLAGDSAPVGMRGGIFLMITIGVAVFFVVRAFAMAFDGVAGQVVSAVVLFTLLFFAMRLFTGRTGERWMISLEEQGWFSFHQYKRSLGVRVRRLTILGILMVGVSGAYSLWNQGVLPDRWTMQMPFEVQTVLILNRAKLWVPVLLALLTLWIAWRAVNVPTFAEFLIATEAEMNKVSWTTRKRLGQDTIVVLITTLIMTLFLLMVDLFWGWLLSHPRIGVLPSAATGADKAGQVQEAKW